MQHDVPNHISNDSAGATDTKSSSLDDVLSFVATGNAAPLLHEIRHALDALVKTGETAIIDLGAIPFASGDERIVKEVLGTGEVDATLTVMGESHVRETEIPGVWFVDHFDREGNMQSRFIEVTFMPEILKTQSEDAERGLEVLAERLITLDDNR